MPPSSSTAVTVAALAAGCSLLAYGAARYASSSSPPRDLDDVDEEDCITPDDVCAIFDKLFLQMQQVVLQLSQQVQQIQMAGQHIPEKQLRQLLKGEFERSLAQCQATVCEDNDVDADCLEEATWEFVASPEEHPKVVRAVERFQKLYDSISGEETTGWTPDKGNDAAEGGGGEKKELTPDELMKAATVYFDAITEKMIDVAESWKEEGKDLKDPRTVQQFHIEASTDANEAGEGALEEEMGVKMSDFRSAIDKHSRIPAVGQTLAMLQMKQQQELMAAGVPMG
ncbi:hypothetical protein ACHAWF_011691 [Thalassiosira exigua]